MPNLYLVGFSGTGKSSVISLLNSKGNIAAIDTDRMIEKTLGLTISDIFKEKGEEEFRKEESKILSKLSKEDGAVIALGGGAVLDDNNLELIKDTGKVVWLDASADVIFERLKYDDTRPLLSGKGPDEISKMKILRDPIYNTISDEVIDTNNLTIKEVVEKVIRYYEGCNWTRQS